MQSAENQNYSPLRRPRDESNNSSNNARGGAVNDYLAPR